MAELRIDYPEELPVSIRRQEILEAISKHQVVVIAGATGSGKTTQLPKMCLELGRKSIAHTQPRRIAARSVAERIAQELKVELGGLVGYQVRFTDTSSKATKVKVMTDGILLNAIQNQNNLSQYDTIIIDEAHERSLNIDFLLGYLKQLLPKRPDLKVIITSATIDPESFSKHFGDAPIIEVSGRTYPIEIRYRPVHNDSESNSDPDDSSSASDYLDGIVKALDEFEKEPEGDTLVFLSGESEIKDAQEAIQGRITSGLLNKNTELLPLYGRLSSTEQHRVFEPSKQAGVRRRVILATNVAETSLTIPNIKYVIDSGTARISRYSPRAKVQRLPIEAISQASANQRAGRAGRTSPGVVIRLYSEEDYNSRSEFTDPEILRTNLASVILQSAVIGIDDISKFPFLQSPDPRGVKDGLGLLNELGALDQEAKGVRLSSIGKELARLPIEPRFARMLLEARTRNLVREVMIIVSGLTIQDPRERPLEKRPQADILHARFIDPASDFLTLLNLYNYLEDKQKQLSSSAFRRLCKSEFLNYLRVREWQDLMRQLQSLAKPLGLDMGPRRKDPEGIHKCLLSGLLSQIGIKQPQEKKLWQNGKAKPNRAAPEYLGAGGKKFVIFPGSALSKKPPEAIISAELVETSRLFARMNAEILPEWAEQLAGDLAKRSFSEPHWEKKLGAVVALERVTLFGLPIVVGRKMQYSRVDPMLCRELFIRHALVEGDWDSQQQFDRENKLLIQELEAQAERARKPELAPGENEIFRFYNNRVPLDVVSTRSFEGWWKKAKQETPKLLAMTKQNLLEIEVPQLSDEELPTQWIYDGQQFNLSYRFDPGAIDDGVTVDIPVAVLAGLQQDPFEWLVPGMRQELVTELIRSLPKSIRKNVVPANDWAKKALSQLPEVPTGGLLDLLARTLQQLSGVAIKPTDFELERLPSSMRMTYRVVDEKGKQLGLSDDLNSLKSELRDMGRGAVAKAVQVTSTIERSGIQAWDFDSVPEVLESEVAGNLIRGFPALVAGPAAVELRLFPTQSERERHHIWGVIALIQKAIPTPAKYISQHLSQQEKLAIVSLNYPDTERFVSDLIAALAEQEIRAMEPAGLVLTKSQFDLIRDKVAAAVIEKSFEVVSILVKISASAAEAAKAISGVKSIDLLPQLTSQQEHIKQLLTPNVVSATGLERLARLPVYLKAAALRVGKLAESPAKDSAAAQELAAALRVYASAGGQLPLDRNAPESIRTARWLLEELRVSLFAQGLGTAMPVSLQRIEKALGS